MTARFVDRPLIETIDSIIAPGRTWEGIQRGGPLPPQSVQSATRRFLASDLFQALATGDLVLEVVPRGIQGWSEPAAPKILPKTFWTAATFAIRRDPSIVGERVFLDGKWRWNYFADAMIREPAVAAEPMPPPAQPVADKRSRRSPASLQMEAELDALLAAEQQFSSQADARHLVLTRLGIKEEARGYGREAFAAIWNRLVKRRQ